MIRELSHPNALPRHRQDFSTVTDDNPDDRTDSDLMISYETQNNKKGKIRQVEENEASTPTASTNT